MGEIMTEQEQYFLDDQRYLDAYSQIAMLLNERREIMKDTSRRKFVPRREKEEHEAALERLNELERAILDGEWFFWEKVEKSKKRGVRFVFEEFAARYGMSHPEKRIALYFLCSRISRAQGFSLSKEWIVEAFDIERSIIRKMENLALFDKGQPLIKSGILAIDMEWERGRFVEEYELNDRFLKYFSQELRGLKPRWDEVPEEAAVIPGVDDIGFIKDPDYAFNDVVLPARDKEEISIFLDTHKNGALKQLGIDKVVKKGKGLTFLFYGPPGTGKSMLADAVASYLKKKILVVDTSKILNRWVGETDKNINKMFEIARANNLVLLLDEADSLLYSRQLVSASHTVHFTNSMLTELERFEGVAVFTSNMDSLLDEAMERRIALKIKFEIPKPKDRSSIWKYHIPPNVKISGDIDFDLLGEKYEFSGGYIKNAVVTALRRIAFSGSDMLSMDDLIHSAETEKEGMFNKDRKRKISGFSSRS